MKTEKLNQMSKVTEAIYHGEFQKVQSILAQEARLRRDLSDLQMRASQQSQALRDDVPMQAIGADVLWNAWLARTQRRLNMELAQVMAKKLTVMDQVRKAFGRQTAVDAMRSQHELQSRQQERKRAVERLLQIRNMR